MKSTIIALALLGGIGIAASEASAADSSNNLSCFTELTADGKVVRDCGPEQEEYYAPLVISEPTTPPSTPPAAMHEGGRKSDGPSRERGERGGTIR